MLKWVGLNEMWAWSPIYLRASRARTPFFNFLDPPLLHTYLKAITRIMPCIEKRVSFKTIFTLPPCYLLAGYALVASVALFFFLWKKFPTRFNAHHSNVLHFLMPMLRCDTRTRMYAWGKINSRLYIYKNNFFHDQELLLRFARSLEWLVDT